MKGRTKREYDVALSFAGEDRDYVEQVHAMLRLAGVRVFYDEFERASLWGKDLYVYVYLHEIYEQRARYCAMFVSHDYVTKAWPRHERRAAEARAFMSRKEYILPIRLDDATCPGIPQTIGYLSGRRHGPSGIAMVLLKKIGRP